MPKVVLTLEEKRRAEAEKEFRRQDRILRDIIREKVHRKISYDELAAKAGVGRNTVHKFMTHPELMRIDLLRKCCIAAEIPLVIAGE
ncbi:MAG: hypothetical protein IKK13_01360 [Clostridia bacterium]|nr:hypothetical protein [Clostridia bacterium]